MKPSERIAQIEEEISKGDPEVARLSRHAEAGSSSALVALHMKSVENAVRAIKKFLDEERA